MSKGNAGYKSSRSFFISYVSGGWGHSAAKHPELFRLQLPLRNLR